MSVEISSLEFTPRGDTGWTTGKLDFGPVTNVFLGPNGAGKTPTIKGIPFALGHPIELPADIRDHCSSVVLTLKDGQKEHRIERTISPGFSVKVVSAGEQHTEITNEKDFSAWLVSALNLAERNFAAKDGTVVPPYSSTFLPMFWVDQDLGWRALYSPLSTHNFLKDQQSEMLRWFLGVPSLNRPTDKSDFKNAKQELEAIREHVEVCRKVIEAMSREVGTDSAPGRRERLLDRQNSIQAELKATSSVLDSVSRGNFPEDEAIAKASADRTAAAFTVESARARMKQMDKLGVELQAEVAILETNEIAAGAFRELCGHEACQFFRSPEESYGRRVLFLKDQLKDFGVSRSGLVAQMNEIQATVSEADRQLESLMRAKKERLASSIGDDIVSKLNELTKELTELNIRIERIGRHEAEQQKLRAAIDKALAAEQEVERLAPRRGGGSDDSRLIEVRGELTKQFMKWLDVLNAQNISQPVYFDDELNLNLGREKFTENSSTSGSTRTRVVLAFHAAVLEASLRLQGAHPRFLILDTPKQNELHTDDLQSYVEQFQNLSHQYGTPLQLIVAATEESFATSTQLQGIRMLRANFSDGNEPRFFGATTGDSSAI
ncbi:MAG TPA: hypothetical protein VK578_04670 [Edaphobacter sp.]|nr:hypothetical protein [Edaphobacter sp.]